MIEISIKGKANLLILNNRVFKRLAELNLLDVIKDEKFDIVDDPEFIEKVGYLCYLEGCKADLKDPISQDEFSQFLRRADALRISNLLIEELIEVGEYVTSKKK
jgi:hypothetical protein